MPPSELDPEGTVRGFEREDVTPTVVPDTSAAPVWIHDVAPTVTTPANLELRSSIRHPIPEESQPHFDGHDREGNGKGNERSCGVPSDKP